MAIVDAVSRKRKLSTDDFELVINIQSRHDYMLLNYFEQEIIRQHGEHFVKQSGDKIQYITGFILNNDIKGLFNMYEGSFNIYMQSCNNDINFVNGFNTVFLVLIHIAMKIIRKHKIETEE
jgi:hypothetical protein